MKKLKWALILIVSIGFGKEHFNPNGHPGTLNIGYTYDTNLNSKYPDDVPYSLIDINMPINTWMTMKFNFKPDFIGYNDLLVQVNMGVDFHIPLYKLWEK